MNYVINRITDIATKIAKNLSKYRFWHMVDEWDESKNPVQFIKKYLLPEDCVRTTSEGFTLLRYYLAKPSKYDRESVDLDFVNFLIESGSDVNYIPDQENFPERTYFQTSSLLLFASGNLPLTKLLISKGIDLEGEDEHGNHWNYLKNVLLSKRKDRIELFDLIKERNMMMNFHPGPLMSCLLFNLNHFEIVKYIFEHSNIKEIIEENVDDFVLQLSELTYFKNITPGFRESIQFLVNEFGFKIVDLPLEVYEKLAADSELNAFLIEKFGEQAWKKAFSTIFRQKKEKRVWRLLDNEVEMREEQAKNYYSGYYSDPEFDEDYEYVEVDEDELHAGIDD